MAEAEGALPADQRTATEDATRLESGLAMRTLEVGFGQKPLPDARVEVRFTGWRASGEFLQRAERASFRLPQVIPGWSEGLQRMVEGERARLWIPEALTRLEDIPAQRLDGDVIFDFELIKVHQPLPAPANVAAPPSDARTTPSGLTYTVLTNGEGGETPTTDQLVRVHYTGWTSDGRMFDSSLDRGEPIAVSPRQVIAGWREGLELMHVGDKVRMWIPESLAYRGKPNRPAGMLVLDVELVEVLALTSMLSAVPAHLRGR